MITSQEMKQMEVRSNTPLIKLMENAGTAFVSELKKSTEIKNKSILVVCYHGKNGGDGFVIADLLSKEAEIDVLFIGDEEKMVKETEHFFHHINNNPLIQFVTLETVEFDDYDLIIDAILGNGLHSNIKQDIAIAIDNINSARAFTVSVDIPTGYHPDTGAIVDKGVDADLIITFHDTKPGLEQFKEKVVIVPIGL